MVIFEQNVYNKLNEIKRIIGETLEKIWEDNKINNINILNEETMLYSFEINSHNLEIRNYDMFHSEDKNYIKQHIDEIWDILQSGYEKHGGFKGFQSRKDLLKKSPFIRLGYCDGNIVAVTVYNDYLGGNKCVGFTCVKDERHEIGVNLLELILKYNIINWNQWVWIEASGKVEEMCKNLGGFNVPSQYAVIYLKHIPFEQVDEYHYTRMIKGKKEQKTIFGFKNKETFEILKKDLNDKIESFIDRINNHKTDITESESKMDDLYQEYLAKRGDCQKYKDIIDYFIYLHEDELINELPIESINILKKNVELLEKLVKSKQKLTISDRILKMTIQEGKKLLKNGFSILYPIAV